MKSRPAAPCVNTATLPSEAAVLNVMLWVTVGAIVSKSDGLSPLWLFATEVMLTSADVVLVTGPFRTGGKTFVGGMGQSVSGPKHVGLSGSSG